MRLNLSLTKTSDAWLLSQCPGTANVAAERAKGPHHRRLVLSVNTRLGKNPLFQFGWIEFSRNVPYGSRDASPLGLSAQSHVRTRDAVRPLLLEGFRVLSSRPTSRVRPQGVGVALAILLWLAFAPSPSRAGCVHPEGATRVLDGGFDRLDAAGALALPDESPRPPRIPGCTGPSCSGRSGLPMIPTTFDPPRFHQWAILSPPLPCLSPTWLPIARHGGESRPVREAAPIFHPPRLFVLGI